METLYYSRVRLVLGFLFFAAVTLGIGYLLFHRDITDHFHGRAMFFGGTFGHYVSLPAIFFLTLMLTFRLAVTAADAKAIEGTSEHLLVSSTWRRNELAWDEVGLIEILVRRTRHATRHELVIHRVKQGNPSGDVRVTLDGTTLGSAHWEEYARMLAATAGQMRGRRAAVPEVAPVSIAPAAATAPIVRGFGRKGL